MGTYAIFSKLDPGTDATILAERSSAVSKRTNSEVAGLAKQWKFKYFVVGHPLVDTLDVVESDDLSAVQRAADIIEHEGGCTTQVVLAMNWSDHLSSIAGSAHPAVKPNPSAGKTGKGGGPGFAIFSRYRAEADLLTLPQRSLAVRHNVMAVAPSLTGRWVCDLALFGGPFDTLDIVETANLTEISLAANVIRTLGQADTEIAAVIPWQDHIKNGHRR